MLTGLMLITFKSLIKGSEATGKQSKMHFYSSRGPRQVKLLEPSSASSGKVAQLPLRITY
jgi:hypothetical protein